MLISKPESKRALEFFKPNVAPQPGRVEIRRVDGREEIVIFPGADGILGEEAVLNLIAIDEFYDGLRKAING